MKSNNELTYTQYVREIKTNIFKQPKWDEINISGM